MKKQHIVLLSSLALVGMVAAGSIEASAQEAVTNKKETKTETRAGAFQVNGITYSPIAGTSNEVQTLTHIAEQLPSNLVIPEKVTDPTTSIEYTVTRINNGSFTFKGDNPLQDTLKSVVVPKTVKQIGSNAFGHRSQLEQVTLNTGLEVIEPNAFVESVALHTINLPEGLKIIGASAFTKCKSLKSITIPDSVMQIGNAAFKESGLTEIRIPAGLVNANDLELDSLAAPNLEKIIFTSGITGLDVTSVFGTPEKTGYTFAGWKDSTGKTLDASELTVLAAKGNFSLTAAWETAGTTTPEPTSGVSDASITILEQQPTGALSFGNITEDAKIVFNDLTLNSSDQTATEDTSKTNAKVVVNDTRTDKTNGWNVAVKYIDTNFVDKKMKLALKPTLAGTALSNVALSEEMQTLFGNDGKQEASYTIGLNPELTIPASFSETGEQKTQIEWTLTPEV